MNQDPLPKALQSDLRALFAESKKKITGFQEAVEKGLRKLKSIEDETPERYLAVISKSEDVLKPFLMVFESKNTKMQMIAMNSLKNLFYHKAVSMASLPSVLSKLAGLVDSETEVQVKILQALVTLFTTTSDLHDDNLAQALVLMFRLHMDKHVNVYTSSEASLRQVITMLFDRTVAEYQEISPRISAQPVVNGTTPSNAPLEPPTPTTEDANEGEEPSPATSSEEQPPTPAQPPVQPQAPAEPPHSPVGMGIVVGYKAPSSLRPCARDTYLLIQDLCLLTGGDPAAWIPLPTLSRAFGLELIELVISHYSRLFLDLEEFSFLLKDRVCPLVIKSFRFRVEFQPTLRLVRIVSAFVCKFCHILATECEVLLSRLINLLGDTADNPFWMQTIALEVCKTFSEDLQLLLSFYVYYDMESVKIFELLVETVAKYALNMVATLEPSHIVLSHNPKGRCLDQLFPTGPPTIKDSYVVSLAVECLVGIVSAIYQLATGNTIESEKPKATSVTAVPPQPKNVGLEMVKCSWNPLFTSLSALLTKTQDEGLIQLLLKAHHLSIHTCGLLHLSTPRDAYLTSLCKACLPPPLTLSQSNLIMSGAALPVPEETAPATPPSRSAEVAVPPSPSSPYPSQKNIVAVNLLLSITPRLSMVLENGWILVLETMEHWDRLLKASLHTSADDLLSPPSSPTLSPLNSQFSTEPTVAEALSSIFKNSNTFDNESVLFMLDGLVRLSTAEIAMLVHNAAASNHMFPMIKLVDSAHANVHRVGVIWPIIMPFLIEAATYRNPTIRNYAVESLTAIIHSSLAHTTANPLASQVNNNNNEASEEGEDGTAKEDAVVAMTKSVVLDRPYPPQSLDGHKLSTQELLVDAMQVKMLEALTELSKNNHNDVKEKTLSAVDALLQSSGQTLNSGWPFLLTILKKVAESNDKIFIPSAFKCVQLICTDFLSNFQPHHLALFISVIGEFGKQSTDINISLTAVGLLWNVADFLAHEHTDKDKLSIYHTKDLSTLPYMKEITSHESTGNEPESDEEDLRPLLDRMWQCVFSVLRPLGTDRRPEVRNCALSTLFKTLTTHAHFLQLGSWPRVLLRLLFPLLDDVRNLAAAAADVKIDNELGGGVMMLVHHSRNTAQKQWDETKVLAMGGIVRVMKMFFDTLRGLPNFITFWTRVVKYLETQATSPSKEVSHAAIGNFQDIIFTHVAQSTCPVDVRDVTWVALERLSVCLTSFPEIAGKSVALFVQILGDMYSKTRTFIVPINVRRLIRMTYPLALYVDPSPPISSGIAVGQPSALQASILSLLQSIPPVPDSVYPLVFTQLLSFVAYAIGYQFTPSHVDPTQLPNATTTTPASAPSVPPTPALQTENVSAYPLAEKALLVISDLFNRDDTSDLIRSAVYGDIANVVGAAMMTKYTRYQAGLWKTAVNTFISMLGVGLPALCQDNNTASEISASDEDSEQIKVLEMTDIQRNIVWTELIDSIQSFLLHDRIPIPQPPEKRAEEEEYDVSLVDAMSTTMVRHCSASSGVHFVHERVVEILSEGVTLTNSGREKFALGCYKNMFALASANTKPRRPASKSPNPSSPVNRQRSSSSSSTPEPTSDSPCPSPSPSPSPFPSSSSSSSSSSLSSTPTPIPNVDYTKLTAMVVPVLLARCREVLQRFVVDDRQSGLCPLPRYRLAEVIFLLRELLYLDLPSNTQTSISTTTPNNLNSYKSTESTTSNGTNCNNSLETTPIITTNTATTTTTTTTTTPRSQHQHLIELYPLFCECITSSEKDLKDLLKEIFYLVGKEFLAVKRL